MNFRMVLYLLGWILNMESVFMALPCVTALIYGETAGIHFLITAVVTAKSQQIALFMREKDL